MFDAHCPSCDQTWLYPLSRIALANTPLGIEVRVHCWCGAAYERLMGNGPRLPSGASCR